MNTISATEILNKKVTLINCSNGADKVGENVPLGVAIYTLPIKIQDRLKKVTNLKYHSEEQKEAKNQVPRYYICGTFDLDDWKYNNGSFPIKGKPIVGTNLMTIDIDAKDNEHLNLNDVRMKIFKLPYVFSCLKSISGQGFYCIIPIEDTNMTQEYYKYIINLWKQEFNINIDSNASSLIRARILSYDDDLKDWIKVNENIQIWKLRQINKPIETLKQMEIYYPKYESKSTGLDWEFITHKAMQLLIADGYNIKGYSSWWYLGNELKNFSDGESLFIQASKNGSYEDSYKTITEKFSQCKATGINDDLIRKWCGMAKNKYGDKWYVKYLKERGQN